MRRSVLALAICALSAGYAAAQTQLPPPPSSPPAAAAPLANNPAQSAKAQTCARLEGQLAMIDRGGQVDTRGEQVRQLEQQISRQQGELDRLGQQIQRLNCNGGFFPFNIGQSPQCGGLNTEIQRARSEMERMQSQLRQIQGGGGEAGERRRAVLIALAQNDCGPQYRMAANAPRPPQQRGGFLDTLFGGPEEESPNAGTPADVPPASTFRTLCVRTCDGFYFPISYATVPSRISTDEQSCRRLCPAAEAVLYSHRNPGEDVSAAVDSGGRSYKELPNAFRFRQAFDPACTCKQAGQSWAEAVTDDNVERGDVIVKEGDKQASPMPKAPAPPKPPAQNRPQQPRAAAPPSAPQASAPPQQQPAPTPTAAQGGPRNVGTPYYR